MPEGFVEYQIQNKDSAKKLHQVEDEIVDAITQGQRIMVRNESDYAVAATTVVETVKSRLHSTGTKVYQANKFAYEPVLAPENPEEPLAKPKTHHYRIKLTMLLSKDPISEIEEVTLQESVSKERKKKAT